MYITIIIIIIITTTSIINNAIVVVCKKKTLNQTVTYFCRHARKLTVSNETLLHAKKGVCVRARVRRRANARNFIRT